MPTSRSKDATCCKKSYKTFDDATRACMAIRAYYGKRGVSKMPRAAYPYCSQHGWHLTSAPGPKRWRIASL